MVEPERVEPIEAAKKVAAGEALLVCAYDDRSKFAEMELEGAIPLDEFRARVSSLAADRQIIFYCACPGEASAAALAERYREMGYTNVSVLRGGVDGWKRSGLAILKPPA